MKQFGDLSKAFNETPVVVSQIKGTAGIRLFDWCWLGSYLFCTAFGVPHPA